MYDTWTLGDVSDGPIGWSSISEQLLFLVAVDYNIKPLNDEQTAHMATQKLHYSYL